MTTITLTSYANLQAQQKVGSNLDGSFNTDNVFGEWSVQNGGSGTVSGGYLNTTMTIQSNSKYRGDIWYNYSNLAANDIILNSTNHAYLAIKFKGSRPDGAIKLEMQRVTSGGTLVWDNTAWLGGSADGSVTTSNGDTIYYFQLTKDADFTGGDLTYRRIHILVADAVVSTSYQVDWIATFSDTASIQTYATLGLSKAEKGTSGIQLYPNPSKENYFSLQLNTESSSEDVNIEIYSLTGVLLKEETYKNSSSTIEVKHNLPKGVYLVQINHQTTTKLIVN